MRIFDYRQSSDRDRLQWMESFQITTGLRYFGGKSTIGKYLMNRICNMAVKMEQDGKGADIFIDAFTGGGKIGLSVPEGWFDTIVMNDLNYGIWSYYMCCKYETKSLIKMIEFIGQHMNKDMYNFIAFNRANNGVVSNRAEAQELSNLVIESLEKNIKLDKVVREKVKKDFLEDITCKEISEIPEDEKESIMAKFSSLIDAKTKTTTSRAKIAYTNIDLIVDEKVTPLVAAAMTYWVTQLEFLGITDPYEVSYAGEKEDNKAGLVGNVSEKEKIERTINHAKRQIPKIAKKLNKYDIIIENLDYRELIKKYNGLEYVDAYGNIQPADKRLALENKLWYFDPPYHPATLYAGNEAPYEDKFSWGLSREMVSILHNEKVEVYGELEYFIKSDYDPKDTYEQFKESLEAAKRKLDKLKEEHAELWEENKFSRFYNDLFGSDSVQNLSDGSVEITRSNKLVVETDSELVAYIRKILTYASRMKQQMEYSMIAYHDFDILEENCDIVDIETGELKKSKVDIPIYYKEILGKFPKGVTDEETGAKLMGTEFIWCRGNYINA